MMSPTRPRMAREVKELKQASDASVGAYGARAAALFTGPRWGRKEGGVGGCVGVTTGAEASRAVCAGSDNVYRIDSKSDKLVMSPLRRSLRSSTKSAEAQAR